MMRTRGFTLVELLIVVAIIGVLAVVAGTAYRKYMDSGRTAEAMAMLGEIRAKQEAYRAEHAGYVNVSSSEATAQGFPVLGSCTEPCYKDATLTASGYPNAWKASYGTSPVIPGLGLNPPRSRLQCGYNIIAGGASTGTVGTLGGFILGSSTPPTMPWWYAVATCNNDGNSSVNATFTTAFNTTVVSAQNEHR